MPCRKATSAAQILPIPLAEQTEEWTILHWCFPLPTRFLSTYSLHLLQHSVFDFDVFKNGFDDHVGFFEAAVVQFAGQVGQDGVPLKRCDAPLFGFVIEPGCK